MAAATAHTSSVLSAISSRGLSSGKSQLSGSAVQGLPALKYSSTINTGALQVVASGGKKLNVKEPYGPCKDLKFKDGLDASGRKSKGKGVYQFGKKYGANVDGYSPIYAPEEWSASGDVYTPGQAGLTLWAVTLSAILLGGALLVYNTSALSQ